MAIQFARIEIVSKSSGGNACRKGAYNARCIIEDQKSNVVFNFSNRGDNVFHQILLPEGANAKYKNPKILMNEVERVEKRKNSQLLKDIVLALPDDKELTLEDRIEITHRLIEKRGWVANGIAVQIDIHQPHDGEKNWHAHLLIPTRRFTSDGLSLGAKAVDLNPDFKKAGGRAYIIPESEQIHEDLKEVINSYFIELGLENRVDEISNMPQEHIGPVRMRAAINQAVIRNQERMQANIESIRDGRNVLARVTKNSSVFSENDVRRVLKCIDNRGTASYLFESAMSDQSIRDLYEADGERTGLYTTTYVQEEEKKLLRLAGYVADSGNINKEAETDSSKNQKINQLIEENSNKLSAEQKQCLSHLLLSDNGIRIMRGRAGAGKSYVLGKFASIAGSCGRGKIIGLAPTHKAKTGLDAIGYRDTDTIKGFLFKLYNGRREVSRSSTIVVDEAAMVGNDDYNELLRVAASYKCNLILAGDEKQLASVGRGGMFEILADKYAGVNLLQIQRQDSSWGKSVAMNMSRGRYREGVATLINYMSRIMGLLQWSIYLIIGINQILA